MPTDDNDPWTMTATGTDTRPFDAGEIRRALSLLVDPDACHELRGLPSGHSLLIRGADLDHAVWAATELADNRSVYYTLNPVRADLGDRGARNGDVVDRRHLLIDVDPVRAEGDGSSTDAEKAAAWAVAEAIAAHLRALGWPEPLVIDSGNGWHLIYRVDLPNDKLAQQWCKLALKALAARFDSDEAHVDRAVHNAARIAKLPGTWARKGPNTADRPHRPCRLVGIPKALTPVPSELVRALGGPDDEGGASPAPAPTPLDPWKMTAGGDDAKAYARSALEREVGKVATCNSNRNVQLYESAMKLAGLVAAGHLDAGEVKSKLTAAARAAGLGADGDPHEVERAIENGFSVGLETPRVIPDRPEKTKGAKGAKAADIPPPPPEGERITIRASEVVPRKVHWIWRDRVAMNFISLFAGRTGLGKSFVTCDMAARLTRGDDMADGPSGMGGECCNVLFISEDPYEYMLAPRLIELGADMERIHFLTWEAMVSYTLADTAFLERAYVESEYPTVIVIDPPTNFLGGTDEHKNAEVRTVLMQLVAWLKSRPVAVILITHVNKQVGKGIEAIDRIMGSVAWASTSRVALVFSADPNDPSRCLFAGSKNNLGNKAKALGYRIVGTDSLAKVEWLGEVDISADEAMNGEKKKPRKKDAKDWLVEIFNEKQQWPSAEFWASARENGITKYAIDEAKAELDIPKARRTVGSNGDVTYTWWVPADWKFLAHAREDDIGDQRIEPDVPW